MLEGEARSFGRGRTKERESMTLSFKKLNMREEWGKS